MKTWTVLIAAIWTAGCAPTPSLVQLEAEAEVTGDWSEVEKYERMLARREARHGSRCPSSQIRYCEEFVGSERCACAPGGKIRALLITR